ncbi:MAG: PBP1A family penicillin-binding protein [Gaiellaceae bacterium]
MKRPRRRIRKLRLLLLIVVLGVLGTTALGLGLVSAIASQIPALDPAAHHQQVNGYIYANDGHTILSVLRGSQARVIVPSNQISPQMKQAIVAIEDKRFYEHRGIDLHGMARAIWADVTSRGLVQGGSTITQQFVKNAYVANERSIARKLKEAALAWQLEQRWSKDRILTAYLNTIYFGNGAYGIQQAALTYFGKGAADLTLPEAALLAGIPEDPSLYDPVVNPRHAKARRDLVLHEMLAQHDISTSDYRSAVRAPLPKPKDVRLPGTQGPSPYFVNYVKQQLIDRYGAGRVFGGGLKVKTTIDLRLQKLAHAAIDSTLTNPDGPTAALVAIDPRTGAVLTMIGGANYHKSQFNLAVQGERQPGSSFKPFVLATALSQGISPATMLTSKPQVISLGDKDWYVHNYEGAYLGPINLTTATVESDNTVYAQLTRIVGPANIVKTAHRLGITSPLQNYFAIGLGVEAVNPLEMARAYGAFANGGLRIDGRLTGNRPVAIASVNGVPNSPQPQRVLSPETDAYVNQILQGVVTSGTGRKAALSDRPVAGKTGTTENFGDAWFVGYTPQLVTAVWVGYPNRYVPMLHEYHGKAVAGGTFPAEIWQKFMTSALKLLDDQPETFPAPPALFQSPRRVVYRNNQIELDNGYCRNTSEIVYFGSAGPARRATCKKNEVEVPRVVGMTLAEAKARLLRQPLLASVVYKPAAPRQRVDIVVDQFPSTGGLSSWDKVTLVMAKPLHGVVPSVVGLDLRAARARLRKAKLGVRVGGLVDGKQGRVLAQAPLPGVAAAPGMAVVVQLGRG